MEILEGKSVSEVIDDISLMGVDELVELRSILSDSVQRMDDKLSTLKAEYNMATKPFVSQKLFAQKILEEIRKIGKRESGLLPTKINIDEIRFTDFDDE